MAELDKNWGGEKLNLRWLGVAKLDMVTELVAGLKKTISGVTGLSLVRGAKRSRAVLS